MIFSIIIDDWVLKVIDRDSIDEQKEMNQTVFILIRQTCSDVEREKRLIFLV